VRDKLQSAVAMPGLSMKGGGFRKIILLPQPGPERTETAELSAVRVKQRAEKGSASKFGTQNQLSVPSAVTRAPVRRSPIGRVDGSAGMRSAGDPPELIRCREKR
jgi:hypothetical protein